MSLTLKLLIGTPVGDRAIRRVMCVLETIKGRSRYVLGWCLKTNHTKDMSQSMLWGPVGFSTRLYLKSHSLPIVLIFHYERASSGTRDFHWVALNRATTTNRSDLTPPVEADDSLDKCSLPFPLAPGRLFRP